MDKLKKIIVPGSIVILFLVIFGRWLMMGVLSTGDWPYLFPQAVQELVPFSTWDTLFNNGMGQSALPKIWFDSYALSMVKLANILSWPLFERVVWFIPYVLVSFISAYFLSKKLGLSRNFNLLSGVVYSLNSYILLIVSGGQAGVFSAYAFLPITFSTFFSLTNKLSLKKSTIFSLILAFQLILDLRVGYMFLLAECVLGLIYIISDRSNSVKKILYFFVIPGGIVLLLHFYWILPIILMGRNPASELPGIYTSSASLDFFSFAKFEDTISLLHPNWPENIFGKVAFLRPEFLIIPLLAFASLLFMSKEEYKRKVSLLSIVLLGLIGAFLAKGTNDPFGELYVFAFNTIPGFVMFRDPTKWYMLTAISFCILIPYTLEHVSKIVSIRFKFKDVAIITSLVFLLFWACLLRDSFNGVVKGTLRPREISLQYQNLAKLIESNTEFSRTMWIPVYPTFAYLSNTHPAIPAVEFFQATSEASLLQKLKMPESEKLLQNVSVKYVIVPEDIDKRIFVSDRKYDERVYKKTVKGIESIPYLIPVGNYGRIKVFEVGNSKGHFWSNSPISIQYKYISPTKYEVVISNAKQGDVIVFNESFDKFWIGKVNDSEIPTTKYSLSKNQNVNSFKLPRNGSYTMEISYKPQMWLNIGLVISGVGLAGVCLLLIRLKNKS